MNSLRYEYLTLIIIALFTPCDCIRDNFTDHNENPEENRYEDVIGALDALYKALVQHHVPLEFRCERYPILISRAETTTGPFLATTVTELIDPDKDFLDVNLRHIDLQRRMSLLMAAIDRYRTTKLGPGFIDLIDCLKRIDRPVVRHYFYDEELVEIEKLHRQVLASPNITFDLDRWKWPRFQTRFGITLQQLFKDNIKQDQIRKSGAKLKLVPSLNDFSNGSGQSTSEHQEKEELEQSYQQRQEERHRFRERDRLRKRRYRILDPEVMRGRDRTNKRKRRETLQLQRAYGQEKRTAPRNQRRLTNRQRIIAAQQWDAQQQLQEQDHGHLESRRRKQQLPDLNEPPPGIETAPEPLDPAVRRQYQQQNEPSVASYPMDRVFLPLSAPGTIFGMPLQAPPQQGQVGLQPPLVNTVPQLPYFSQFLDSQAASFSPPAQYSSDQHAQKDRHQQVTTKSSGGTDGADAREVN